MNINKILMGVKHDCNKEIDQLIEDTIGGTFLKFLEEIEELDTNGSNDYKKGYYNAIQDVVNLINLY